MRRGYIVRLYQTHDSDLILYALTHDVDMVVALYVSLSAYVRGQKFTLDSPVLDRPLPNSLRRSYSLQLRLDEQKDKKLIQVLDSIQAGYRNIFFRTILRLYLNTPINIHQLNDSEDMNIFTRCKDAFQSGTRVVMLKPASTRIREKRRIIDEQFDGLQKNKKKVATETKKDTKKKLLEHEVEPKESDIQLTSQPVSMANTQTKQDLPEKSDDSIERVDSIKNPLPSNEADASLFDELLDMLGQ